MITIRKLDPDACKGMTYEAKVESEENLTIIPVSDGFQMIWEKVPGGLNRILRDTMLSEWLEDPVAYGAYDGENLIGFTEGFLEKWNNRYRISNIAVFDIANRSRGIGTLLMEAILKEAKVSGARMAVLETQNFNHKAIRFYQKNGFEIIGFDRYAYSNNGPEEHNMRIEMGLRL